jgi:hypothetical protein
VKFIIAIMRTVAKAIWTLITLPLQPYLMPIKMLIKAVKMFIGFLKLALIAGGIWYLYTKIKGFIENAKITQETAALNV